MPATRVAEQQADALGRVCLRVAPHQATRALLAQEDLLRERRPVVGRLRLVADQQDLALGIQTAQELRRAAARLAGANDHRSHQGGASELELHHAALDAPETGGEGISAGASRALPERMSKPVW